MKVFKRIIAVLIVIATFAITFFVAFGSFLFASRVLKPSDPEAIYAKDVAISSSDPGCYFLKKASKNIAFRVNHTSAQDPYGFILTDESGKNVKSEVTKEDGCFVINPPKSGYKEGETYTLVLAENTYFADTDIAPAKKLVFTIDRKDTQHHKFKDEVVEAGDSTLDLDYNGNLIIPDDMDVSEGDIVFGQDQSGDYVAYKILDTDGNTATVELPAADEVYEELVIYGEQEWDVTKIEQLPNLEVEILNNFIGSDLYNEVMAAAYVDDEEMFLKMTVDETDIQNLSASASGEISSVSATPSNLDALAASVGLSAEDFEFKLETDEANNTVTFQITIPIQPGESGSFGDWTLKNHVVKLTLSSTVGCSSYTNIKSIKNWDLSYTVSSDFSWSVDFELIGAEYTEDPDLDDLLMDGIDKAKHHKLVKGIADKLAEITEDRGRFAVDLFKWKIPLGATGLCFEAEIELAVSFEAAAMITIGNSHSTQFTAGVRLCNKEFESYKNEYTSKNSPTLTLRGTIGVKLGVQFEMVLSFIDEDIANIALTPQVGAYADLYVLAPILDYGDFEEESGFYAHLETGVYLQAELSAYVNLLGKNDLNFGPVLLEAKIPIPKDGIGASEIPLSVEPTEYLIVAENGIATIPDIVLEYYDVTSGVRKRDSIDIHKIKFYDESGNEISVSSSRKFSVPNPVDGEDFTIRAEYEHEDNKKVYDAKMTVTLGKGTIIGHVSAFNDGNHMSLSGATVSLYHIDDLTDPVASKTTDAEGKFTFNVVQGTYKLKISAERYKTLVTTQEVKRNDTKYTEHLLLIDKDKDGLGTAGGTISNALNGRGVSNAQIKLRKEWNNKSGEYFGTFTTSTDSYGEYHIEDIPIGYYTVEATANDYVKSYCNILILDDEDLVDFDFTMTPVIAEGEVRIILDWGASPSDLDSHLIGRTPSGNTFNVYFSDQVYTYNGVEMVNLDHDDTTSYGPETITILESINGTYTYIVHDYSNRNYYSSTAMSYSGARVRVLIGGREDIEEFYVPTGISGTYWTVFKIDAYHNIIPVNSISNTKPSA